MSSFSDDSWDQIPERAPTGDEMDPRLYLGFDQFKRLHPSQFGPGSVAARVRLPIAKTGVGYEKLRVRAIRINAPESRVPLLRFIPGREEDPITIR
jgi:hypothetical protein